MKKIIIFVSSILFCLSFVAVKAIGSAYPIVTDNVENEIGTIYSGSDIRVVLVSDDGSGSYTYQDSIKFNEDIELDDIKGFFTPKALPNGLEVDDFQLENPTDGSVDYNEDYDDTQLRIILTGNVPVTTDISDYDDDLIQMSIPASCLDEGYAASEPLTLHATFSTGKYLLTCVKYEVTFDVQGHGIAPETQSIQSGFKAIKPDDPSESGWVFKGWYKEAACENVFDFDSETIIGNTTVYALWKKYVAPYVEPVEEPVFEIPNTGVE